MNRSACMVVILAALATSAPAQGVDWREKLPEAEVGHVTLDGSKLLLADLIPIFERASGATIECKPTLAKNCFATAYVPNLPWRPVLDAILTQHGLTLKKTTPGAKSYIVARGSVSATPAGKPEQKDPHGRPRTDAPISITLNSVPLTYILRMFAQLGAAGIVAGADMMGTATVNLTDCEWEAGLNAILAVYGRGLRQDQVGSGVWRVVKVERAELAGTRYRYNTGLQTRKRGMSITLISVPFCDVVRMFTRVAGANIVAEPLSLGGTVCVALSGRPWAPSLAAILATRQMELREFPAGSGIYRLTPIQPSKDEDPAVKPLEHAALSLRLHELLAKGDRASAIDLCCRFLDNQRKLTHRSPLDRFPDASPGAISVPRLSGCSRPHDAAREIIENFPAATGESITFDPSMVRLARAEVIDKELTRERLAAVLADHHLVPWEPCPGSGIVGIALAIPPGRRCRRVVVPDAIAMAERVGRLLRDGKTDEARELLSDEVPKTRRALERALHDDTPDNLTRDARALLDRAGRTE